MARARALITVRLGLFNQPALPPAGPRKSQICLQLSWVLSRLPLLAAELGDGADVADVI